MASIRLKSVRISDESTMKAIVDFAMALRGGAVGIAKYVVSELVVAAMKKAAGLYHTHQISNQADGIIRNKKDNSWREFSRTGKTKTVIIYQFADRRGKITEVKYDALLRSVGGFLEVACLNPKRGGTALAHVTTKLKTKQLAAHEWTAEGWSTWPK